MDEALTNETVDLLQALIRNQCVNDGTPESGEEVRNSDLLETFLEGAGLDLQTYETEPGRKSLVARIEGSDPEAPTVCLMGHTDVVPVNPDGWRRDPFGGELVDGEVWGRGAVDMLNLTSSMAVAFRHLARTGYTPRGTLIYFAVADEEAGGTYGAKPLVEEEWDAIGCDYLLTEMGGIPMKTPTGTKLRLTVAEKGIAWRRIICRGTPGHGSMPFASDNALVKAAEVVRRLAAYRPAPKIHDLWRAEVTARGLPEDQEAALLDPERLWEALEAMPPASAKHSHACTHTTFSPNFVSRPGQKTNVIPDLVAIDVDIRTLPGESDDDVTRYLREALGDMADEVEWRPVFDDQSSRSSTDTPMWDTLARHMQNGHPGAELVPSLIVGATDSRFFRQRGTVAYGAGLFSPHLDNADFWSRFHGNDERIDLESLALTTQLWLDVATDLLGPHSS